MATETERESLLQLCSKATQLGNSISTRMIEFLKQVKHQPLGFRDLGHEFLDVCRILTSIEAGLVEFLKTNRQFSQDMLSELDKKFRQTAEDFLTLKQLLQKFLDYEKGGALAAVQKRWRMVFADKDIAKVRNSLQRNHEALKMSMLIFSWDPYQDIVPVAAEYKTLAAYLESEKAAPETPTDLVPSAAAELEGTTVQHVDLVELDNTEVSISELSESTYHNAEPTDTHPYISLNSSRDQESASAVEVENQNLAGEKRTASTVVTQKPQEEAVAERANDPEKATPTISAESTATDDSHKKLAALTIAPQKPRPETSRVKPELPKVKRRQPTNPATSNPPSLQNALLSAVQGKRHKVMEQLLNRGVSPNTAPRIALLEAATAKDLDTTRLLLEFGANPDGADGAGVTPLCATVAHDRNFIEGTELLLAYGADPNRKRGDGWSPLTLAVFWNHPEQAEKLLQCGADPNLAAPETPLVTAAGFPGCLRVLLAHGADTSRSPGVLELAVWKNSVPAIELLLDSGVDVNEKHPNGCSPLTTAIRDNRHDILTLLLARGADPNLKGDDVPIYKAMRDTRMLRQLVGAGAVFPAQFSVVELAVYWNNREAVEFLLDRGADVNAKSDNGCSPLTTAVRDNRPELLELLLARGADPNLKGQDWPVLMAVAKPQLLKLLVDAGSSVVGKSVEGVVTAAVHHGNVECVTLLLDKGADANGTGLFGHTPLTAAVHEKRREMLELLLARGADPDRPGYGSLPPLHEATKYPELLGMLLAAGADPKRCPGVLQLAAFRKQLDSVRRLVAAGVSANEPDKKNGGMRPLVTAVREKCNDIVRYLVDEAGADIALPGENETLPLTMAVSKSTEDDTEMVSYLLENGADPNAVQGNKWTAFMEAVNLNKVAAVKLLLAHGAVDLDLTDLTGKTPLDIAANRGYDEVVEILLEAM